MPSGSLAEKTDRHHTVPSMGHTFGHDLQCMGGMSQSIPPDFPNRWRCEQTWEGQQRDPTKCTAYHPCPGKTGPPQEARPDLSVVRDACKAHGISHELIAALVPCNLTSLSCAMNKRAGVSIKITLRVEEVARTLLAERGWDG